MALYQNRFENDGLYDLIKENLEGKHNLIGLKSVLIMVNLLRFSSRAVYSPSSIVSILGSRSMILMI